jgi:hypothetical protein
MVVIDQHALTFPKSDLIVRKGVCLNDNKLRHTIDVLIFFFSAICNISALSTTESFRRKIGKRFTDPKVAVCLFA